MKKGMQNVIVRFDTEIQVKMPACGECNGSDPCPKCREIAVNAAVWVIRGSWSVDVPEIDRGPDDDGWLDVYSDCSDSDVTEVRVE